MAEFPLTELDREYLRACPQRVVIHRASHGRSLATEQYTRKQRLRLVRGEVDVDASSREMAFVRVTLTDDGRKAIGQPVQGGGDADQHA
jgi:hypothetical protein